MTTARFCRAQFPLPCSHCWCNSSSTVWTASSFQRVCGSNNEKLLTPDMPGSAAFEMFLRVLRTVCGTLAKRREEKWQDGFCPLTSVCHARYQLARQNRPYGHLEESSAGPRHCPKT